MSSAIARQGRRGFGDFELDDAAHELSREGRRVRLQEQPYRVLTLLLDRSGEVVTREEFHRVLWPGSIYVDFDHGLNNAIARLRQVLGDDSESPRYIETLPRVGYRWTAGARPVEPPATGGVAVDSGHSMPGVPTARPSRGNRPPAALALLAVIVVALLAVALLSTPGEDNRPTVTAIEAASPVVAQRATAHGSRSAHPEAQRLYEIARTMLMDASVRRDREGARQLFERAIAIDPQFAAAHAGLAIYHFSYAWGQVADIEADVARGRAAAERAFALAPTLPDALRARADYALWRYRFRGDYQAYLSGLADYRRAIAADPAEKGPRFSFARCVLWIEPELSVELLRETLQVDPLSQIASDLLANTLLVLGRVDEAHQECARPMPPAPDRRSCELARMVEDHYLGNLAGAVSRIEGLQTPVATPTRTGDQLSTRLQLWAAYLSLGDRVAARKALELGSHPAGSALAAAARLSMDGRMREAFELLDRRRVQFPESRLLDLPTARLALIIGQPQRAVALLESRLPDLVAGIEPVNSRNVMPGIDLVTAWREVGQRAQAGALLRKVERFLDGPGSSPLPMFAYQRARAHALAGEHDRAWAALDRAYTAGQRSLWAVDLLPQPHFYVDPVAADPAFALLHDHPRFLTWLGRVENDNARQLALLRSMPQSAPAARASEAKPEQGEKRAEVQRTAASISET